MFDEEQTALFGTKIIWLSRIMKYHVDCKNKIDESTRGEPNKRLIRLERFKMILHIIKKLNLKM